MSSLSGSILLIFKEHGTPFQSHAEKADKLQKQIELSKKHLWIIIFKKTLSRQGASEKRTEPTQILCFITVPLLQLGSDKSSLFS